MTAEVAVLNKSAVALAADSAMSVTVGNTKKTFPTNKLFALTKHRPMGVMIYNNAEFMDIPWETIVKMYRQEIGLDGKATVTQYAEDFLGFAGKSAICTNEQRHRNLLRIAASRFRLIARHVEATIRNTPTNGDLDTRAMLIDIVANHTAALVSAGPSPSMEDLDAGALVREHEADINDVIDHFFSSQYSSDSTVRQALSSVLEAAIKSVEPSDEHSGVVLAGFGDEEIFPSLVEVVTDGAIGDVVKADIRISYDVARTGTHTAIVPFAQHEMVERFMEGIDPGFVEYLESYFGRLLTSVFHDILESTAAGQTLTGEQIASLHQMVDERRDQFRQDMRTLRKDAFVDPILEIVHHLPKEELASMAEALVSLTSLKRRVSKEYESVSGPVDVAVVSKGDGFIWIKRKHYFDPMLNRDYLFRQSPYIPSR